MMERTVIILILTAVLYTGSSAQTPTPSPTPVKANSRPAAMPTYTAEPFDKAPVKLMTTKCVTLITDAGELGLELYPESAPETVRNFLNLVSIKAFDTTTFSRVVPGFVIQGGNIGTREGVVSAELGRRARKMIPDEPNRILHERGVLSMARSDEPNTSTTHFFILVNPAPYLDGKFAAFGRVTRGMEVVDVINRAPVEGEVPLKPVRIRKAVISECQVPQVSQSLFENHPTQPYISR